MRMHVTQCIVLIVQQRMVMHYRVTCVRLCVCACVLVYVKQCMTVYNIAVYSDAAECITVYSLICCDVYDCMTVFYLICCDVYDCMTVLDLEYCQVFQPTFPPVSCNETI